MKRVVSAALAFACMCGVAKAQIEIKNRLPAGETLRYEQVETVEQELEIMGQSQPTTVESRTVTVQKVHAKGSDGKQAVEFSIEALRGKIELAFGSAEFDSETKVEKVSVPFLQPIIDSFKTLKDAKYTLVYDENMNVVETQGVEEALKNAAAQTKQMMEQQLSVAAQQQIAAEKNSRFPKTEVEPGYRWTAEVAVPLGAGQVLKLEREFEYKGQVEVDCVKLEEITMRDLKVLGFEVGMGEVKDLELAVESSEGKMLYDNARGAEVETTRKKVLKGSLKFVAMGQEIPAKLKLDMSSSNKLLK